MLNVWRHPKNDSVRLYVAPAVVKSASTEADPLLDPKTVKAWLEEGDGKPVLKVVVRSDDPVAGGLIAKLKAGIQGALGLSFAEPWADLVRQSEADNKPKKKGRPGRQVVNPESRAREASRLDVSSIKMPGDITIEVDHRETKLISELLSGHPNIRVKRVTLELGDFRVEDREGNELLIERKRCEPTESAPDSHNDFESSIVGDGRLFDQAERLHFRASNSDHQVIPVVLIEGDVHRHSQTMLIQQVDGALSWLVAIQRVSILTSLGANHSAYQIAKLASHFVDGLFTPIARHKKKPKALVSQKLYVLESLPGISTGIAEALLERFGSIRAMAQASELELASVKGVGPKRSREIARVLGEL
ncbi:ERCC4 domain-containing protein [Marinobacter alkaliphilus]|uniref:ERCC4 domain-containing protein n=1 Tax=Marinobacter alkaliphilus TaxID=254719 RepID=A0ABZ3E954_9GAMM